MIAERKEAISELNSMTKLIYFQITFGRHVLGTFKSFNDNEYVFETVQQLKKRN